MGNHQTYQHTYYWSLRMKRVKKRQKKEILFKNFPNLIKYMNIHIQESQQTLTRTNLKKSTPQHIIIKLLKDKHREILVFSIR